MKRVVLHIDRLVLNGIDHARRADVATALRSELTRLLGDARAVDRLAALDGSANVRVASMTVAHDAKPRDVGAQAARSLITASRR